MYLPTKAEIQRKGAAYFRINRSPKYHLIL
jgi:hypothetical protein